MEQIYIIGDIHTVSAFRLSGVTGIVSRQEDAAADLEQVIRKGDAAIVAITNDLADGLQERIGAINLQLPAPVVIAIPGIDDVHGFRRSAMSYVSEALGIAL
ncbi:MAG: V-type ATP synthase subunit F [Syntrophaceae bacterium]